MLCLFLSPSCIPSLCENIYFWFPWCRFLPMFWPFPLLLLSGDMLHFPPLPGYSVLAADEQTPDVLIQCGCSNHFALTIFGNPKCISHPVLYNPAGFKWRPCGSQKMSARTMKCVLIQDPMSPHDIFPYFPHIFPIFLKPSAFWVIACCWWTRWSRWQPVAAGGYRSLAPSRSWSHWAPSQVRPASAWHVGVVDGRGADFIVWWLWH